MKIIRQRVYGLLYCNGQWRVGCEERVFHRLITVFVLLTGIESLAGDSNLFNRKSSIHSRVCEAVRYECRTLKSN